MQPQPGIFALGSIEHAYLELDLRTDGAAASLAAVLAGLIGPATTVTGVNVVVGFRSAVWSAVTGAPAVVADFAEVSGAGVTMPATQHDAWVWIAGGARDVVFDSAVAVVDLVQPYARVATEVNGWLYQHRRDLTGFVDGTENPSQLEAQGVAAGDDGTAVLLYQQWEHAPTWRKISVAQQEKVIGRTKADSVEFAEDVMPADSHVSRNVISEGGVELDIYRRNTAYGGATSHGTVFVGFCKEQRVLQLMLDRMAGAGDGIRDALTLFTQATSGAYYVVPGVEALTALVPDEED